MAHESTTASSCLSRLFQRLRINRLSPESSSNFSPSTRLIAQISATGLVLASAGFGAVYAWTTGSQHGMVLGGLMVLMAVALELAKPLSAAGALTALRSFRLGRGAALGMLAAVAVAFSLTSELSLMATTRGDGVASRQAVINATSKAETEANRANEAYERAKVELSAIPYSRPPAELQAEIDGLLLTPGADGCAAINGKVTKEVCPKVALLKTEKARADRRAELEKIIAKPLPITASTTHDKKDAVGTADPAASALSAYLEIFGIAVAPAVLSEWLVLVGVLALEVGSTMAGVLAQSFGGPSKTARPESVEAPMVQPPAPAPKVQVVHPAKTGDTEEVDQAREKVKAALVQQLKAHGGSVSSGERGLAKRLGANRSTMKRAINGLVLAGVIAAEATRNGTVLRLLG